MDRRLLVAAAVLAAVLAPGGLRTARADRLGGNYRGTEDIRVPRDNPPPPELGDDPTPPPGPGGGSDGGSDGGDAGGGGDGEEPPYGNGHRGPAGEVPPGPRQPEDPPPPDCGGGTPPGDEAGPPPEPGAAPSRPESPQGGSEARGQGSRTASHDDRDRTWTFYFESCREEYLAAVLARRPEPRIAPPGTSSWMLSLQPEPTRKTRPILEGDRLAARSLVVERLGDADPRVRDAAVLALGKSGCAEAVPLLRRAAWQDPDPAVREDAFLALGLAGRGGAALQTLLRALAVPPDDPRERRAAFAALGLGLSGEREWAAGPLRDLYAGTASRPDRVEEAACAAAALGMLGDREAPPHLERSIGSRSAPLPVRCYAIHALGKFAAHAGEAVRRRAREVLSAAAADGDRPEIRQSALLALGGFSDLETLALLAREGLLDPDSHCRNFAAHSMGRIAGRAGPGSREHALASRELARYAGSERRDRWLFQAGNVSLSAAALPEIEGALLDLAGDGTLNDHSASSVVLSLGLLGASSEAATARLRDDLESRSRATDVRGYAGLALALTGAGGSAASLARALRAGREEPRLARSVALALGLVGGAEERDLLVGMLAGTPGGGDADAARHFLLGAAVQGLGLIGDGDTVERLRPLLASPGWRQRAFATAALGYVLEPDPARRVAPLLSAVFRHHNYHVPLPVVEAVQSAL